MLRIKSELFGTIELPIDEIESGDAWHGVSPFLDINVFVDYEERWVGATIYPVNTDKGTVNTNYELESINFQEGDDNITCDFDPFYCPNMTDQEKCVEYFRLFGCQARVFRDNDVLLHIPEFNGEVILHPEEIATRANLYATKSQSKT